MFDFNPYTLAKRPRHIACAILLFLAAPLGACSSLMSASTPEPVAAAAPAGPAAQPSGAESDWEAVKHTVARLNASSLKDHRLEWTNAETGNSGTITDIVMANRNGLNCRGFSTTLASMDGVRAYRGELCKGRRGDWEYVTVEPSDGKPKDPG